MTRGNNVGANDFTMTLNELMTLTLEVSYENDPYIDHMKFQTIKRLSAIQFNNQMRLLASAKEKSRRLSVIFAFSFWWLWRYRNSIIFCHHPIRRSDI